MSFCENLAMRIYAECIYQFVSDKFINFLPLRSSSGPASTLLGFVFTTPLLHTPPPNFSVSFHHHLCAASRLAVSFSFASSGLGEKFSIRRAFYVIFIYPELSSGGGGKEQDSDSSSDETILDARYFPGFSSSVSFSSSKKLKNAHVLTFGVEMFINIYAPIHPSRWKIGSRRS